MHVDVVAAADGTWPRIASGPSARADPCAASAHGSASRTVPRPTPAAGSGSGSAAASCTGSAAGISTAAAASTTTASAAFTPAAAGGRERRRAQWQGKDEGCDDQHASHDQLRLGRPTPSGGREVFKSGKLRFLRIVPVRRVLPTATSGCPGRRAAMLGSAA